MMVCALASSTPLCTPLAVMSPRWMQTSGFISSTHRAAAVQLETRMVSVVERCVSETIAIFMASIRNLDAREIGSAVHAEGCFVAERQADRGAANDLIRIGIADVEDAGAELNPLVQRDARYQVQDCLGTKPLRDA